VSTLAIYSPIVVDDAVTATIQGVAVNFTGTGDPAACEDILDIYIYKVPIRVHCHIVLFKSDFEYF
jgi:hypothetical protein